MASWDDLVREAKGEQTASKPVSDFDRLVNEAKETPPPRTSTEIQQPTVTQQQGEPFQLRMAKQQATENEIRRRLQDTIGGIAESSVKDTQQKRANQAAADKEYRNSVWDFLNTMISNAGAGGAGVVASPMDAAEAHGNLQEARAKSDKAAAAFDKQSFGERQGHELSGWGQRTIGNLGNALATLGTQYSKSRAMQIANDPAAAITAAASGEDQTEHAKRIEKELISEETRNGRNAAQETFDRFAERGNEELQRAKDGASALGRLGLDLETGALDLGADALTNAVAPGAGMVSMGARVFGEAAREERQKGGDIGRQMLAGTKAAAIEVLTEKISGPFEKIYGKSFAGKAINKAIDAIDSKGGRAAIKLLSDALGEGAEEVLSDLLNPTADYLLGLADSWDEAWADTTPESVLYDGTLGFLLGAAGSAGQIISTKGRITPEDIPQIKADAQVAGENAVQEAAQQTAPAAAENPAQSAEIERDASVDIPAPPATENAATGESERLNRASVAEGTAPVETRTPAGDFIPRKTTKWNPNSQRGKAEIKAARQLRRDTGLWSSSQAAVEAVHRVAESMRDRGRGTDVMDVARQAVDEMLQTQKSGIESGDRDLYNRIREYLRGTDIQVSDELRGDIADFTAWKREAMKKIRLRQNGRPIDSVYAELSNIAGEGVLPPDVTAHSDQIANILHLLDTLRPQAVMMSEAFTGADYEAIRDGIAGDLARAAAQSVGGRWANYEPGGSMGGKSEAAVRHDAIELEMEVAAMDGENLSREDAARIVDERYIKYGVYNEADVMAMEETEESESGTDETGEETETAPGDAETETERPADTGAAEDGGAGVYGVAGRDVPAQQQAGERSGAARPGNIVERGFSENVRTDTNMEQAIRDDFTADPEYYTQLANKDTLGKAQAIYDRGIDEARATVDRAIEAAKSGRKLAPEMVPLARMVANELTRNGEKASARRILSDLAVELTQAGQLGQAAKILRSTDAQTALKTVQKALDKINAEIKKKRGNRAKWKAELTDAEIEMLNNIDMGDEAAFQEAYKQIANRIGKEMPATLWEKITELRRINMLLKPRTQIRNFASNAPMVLLRKGAETMSGAIQDAMVKLGTMDKAQQTRTLKVSKEIRNKAKEYVKANKDSILSEGNKWDMNTMLRESRTYFKGGALEKAISKLSGKEQQALLEQARRFTYKLLEKGDAPFVMSAYTDSLAQYMASQGLTDFDNIPQAALDFASANAMEATFKNASTVASFINQIKRNGGALGKALDVVFPFTTTPANIFNLMVKYSPAGFADTISKAVKKANAPDIIDSASKATVGSAVFGLGLLLRSLGAITGKPDDDEDKRALDKVTGKSPYSIAGRWSYDWAQPVGSLLVLGAETWDAIQGQEGVGDAIMNAIYSAGDSALNMSLFQNVTSMLKGYGSNTEKILNAIVEGGGTQLVPGLAGDIAALIDDTVRSSYTGGNVFQNTLAKMGMNIPGLSKTLSASVNVKGEENKRGPLWFRGLERLVDPGTYNRNEMTDSDRAIYDLYEDTGDKTIFPHVAPTKFDYDGETYRMTGDERAQFQTTQGQIYYEMLDAMLDSGEWDDMSRAAKVKMLQDAAAYATDEAKRELVEARGGEYKSSDWEGISTFADGDSELASQILSVRNEAKKAIESGEPDILDRLLGKDGAYNNLSDEAKDLLNVKQLGHIVDMHDNGLDAAGALTVLDALAAAKTEKDDGKDLSQAETVNAIVGTDLTDKEKLSAIKAYTSDAYMEGLQAAVGSGVSLEKWSEVRNKYADIKENKDLTAMQKATQFAAALDKDKSLNENQRKVLREQLTYSSMSTAEAKRYDELTDTGMSIDTATKVTDLLASVKPLEGKTSVTQLQRADAIANGGLTPGDTWAALKVYTGESFYNKAAEAYKKGIDLDDYISNFQAVDTNDSGDLTQAELYAFYMQNPKQNETYCKVMLMILSSKTDWGTFLKKQAKAAKKQAK